MQDQREGLIDSQGLFVHKERIHVPFFFKKFVFILFFFGCPGSLLPHVGLLQLW